MPANLIPKILSGPPSAGVTCNSGRNGGEQARERADFPDGGNAAKRPWAEKPVWADSPLPHLHGNVEPRCLHLAGPPVCRIILHPKVGETSHRV